MTRPVIIIAHPVWKPIDGFEGRYAVSNNGQVKRVARMANRRDGRPYTVSETILKQDTNNGGYSVVTLRASSRKRRKSVHRLVAEAFHGACPAGMECCHNDGDRENNNAENLRWDTHSANMADAAAHGTHNKAKLSPNDVRGIRHAFLGGATTAGICKLYGIDATTARRIRARKIWKNV